MWTTHRRQSLTDGQSFLLYLKYLLFLIKYLLFLIKNKDKKLKEIKTLNTYKSVIVLSILILTTTPIQANATHANKAIMYSYAGSLLTPLELSAAIKLWNRESQWNVHARNGSHYGICQGRSSWLARQDYKKQVRWCIAYAWNRYGTLDAAWRFFESKGYH